MLRKNKTLAMVLAALIGIGMISAGAVSVFGTEEGLVESQETPITRAAEKVGPAVPRVEVTKSFSAQSPYDLFDDPFFRYFFGEPPRREEREVESLGSGFVINWQGKKYVLTNQHVVEDAKEIRLVFKEGMTYRAKVIGSDEMIDVAVLEFTGDKSTENIPTVSLGDPESTPIGSWVVAIGNPEGFENTVTAGVLSARNRSIPKPNSEGSYQNLLQTDAAINPGNSGGPLVNMKGNVIGMNTAIIRRNQQGVPITGLNFAVSIDSVKQVLSDLVSEGEVTRAWLGVWFQEVTPEMGEKFGLENGNGVLISEIIEDSPAAEAGLKAGDVIVKLDGTEITGSSQFQQEIMYREVGEKIDLTIIRNQQKQTVTVTLGERDEEPEQVSAQKDTTTDEEFGLTLAENSLELQEKYDLITETGLVVTKTQPFGPGGKLREGDVLLQAGKSNMSLYTLKTVEDWQEVTSNMKQGDTLLVRIIRETGYRWITLQR